MDIRIKRGLKIPLSGEPSNEVKQAPFPKLVALDVSIHEALRFQILVKPGDKVLVGDPVLADQKMPSRLFVSPASGTIKEIIRGEKRRILFVSIETDAEQSAKVLPALENPDAEEIVKRLLESGLFTSIYQRPCKRLVNPDVLPEAIFVKASESAPFLPSPELEINEQKENFTGGLEALKKLTKGAVHLVSDETISCPEGVQNHTVSGLHPRANASVHIYHIHPIKNPEQVIWTLTAHTVIAIGAILKGEFYQSKLISLSGEGVKEQDRMVYRVIEGSSMKELLENRVIEGELRLISGDPLMGHATSWDGFLTRDAFAVCALPDQIKRTFSHFLGLGVKRYTATRTYLSALFSAKARSFSTSQHGEERAFVDGSYYDKVMPMRIPTMQLVKALIAEDFEKAVSLGLLEVDAEDFALPSFICPSKIAMTDIVKRGQQLYAEQYLS